MNKLFNLAKDSLEMNNLALNKKYAEKLKEIIFSLEAMMDQKNDPMTSLTAADYSVINKKKKH